MHRTFIYRMDMPQSYILYVYVRVGVQLSQCGLWRRVYVSMHRENPLGPSAHSIKQTHTHIHIYIHTSTYTWTMRAPLNPNLCAAQIIIINIYREGDARAPSAQKRETIPTIAYPVNFNARVLPAFTPRAIGALHPCAMSSNVVVISSCAPRAPPSHSSRVLPACEYIAFARKIGSE